MQWSTSSPIFDRTVHVTCNPESPLCRTVSRKSRSRTVESRAVESCFLGWSYEVTPSISLDRLWLARSLTELQRLGQVLNSSYCTLIPSCPRPKVYLFCEHRSFRPVALPHLFLLYSLPLPFCVETTTSQGRFLLIAFHQTRNSLTGPRVNSSTSLTPTIAGRWHLCCGGFDIGGVFACLPRLSLPSPRFVGQHPRPPHTAAPLGQLFFCIPAADKYTGTFTELWSVVTAALVSIVEPATALRLGRLKRRPTTTLDSRTVFRILPTQSCPRFML